MVAAQSCERRQRARPSLVSTATADVAVAVGFAEGAGTGTGRVCPPVPETVRPLAGAWQGRRIGLCWGAGRPWRARPLYDAIRLLSYG